MARGTGAGRGIFKNPSLVSFSTTDMLGVMSFSWNTESDVDRNSADNEKNSIIYGVQNYVGTAELETGDIGYITSSAGFSMGETRSLRATAVARFPSTELSLTVIMATAYCTGINFDVPHGDAATARITWEFNTAGLSFAHA